MKKLITHISLIVLLAVMIIPAEAQVSRKILNRNIKDYFLVDHAAFVSDSTGKFRLEVYYQIYNRSLNFNMKKNGSFSAEYEIDINVYNNKNKVVGKYHQEKVVTVATKSKSASIFDYRTNQVNFILPAGKHEIKLYLMDPTTENVVTKKFKVNLKKTEKKKKPFLSDIELVQLVAPRDENPSVFEKGEMIMVPSVTHRYGSGEEDMRIFFYTEIYHGKESFDDVRIETVLRHSFKGMLYRDSLYLKFDENKTPIKQFREISIDDLRPGHYELIVTLRGKRNKKLDVKYRDFELIWSQKSMMKHDFKNVVAQLALIGNSNEMKLLKNIEIFEDKIIAFNQFWEKRDPTPGTPENEAKNEFYRRVNIANNNFSFLYNNGWRTDRGRVYIVFGEPDQIDDYPMVPEGHPFQEWHYYRYSKYRMFRFVDEKEDGDYRLVYPYDGLFLQPGD